MTNYIARRLLLIIPVLLVVSILIFVIMRIVPGDIAVTILMQEGSAAATPEAVENLRHKLGTDRPLYEQYATWIWGLIRLSPGNSLWTGRPIIEELGRRFPVTLELTLLAVVVSIIIAVPIGVLSALRQDTWVDYLFRVVSIAGIAMPMFWTGTLIIMFLVRSFRWMPPLGYENPFANPVKNLEQLMWPAVALGYYLSAVLSRMTRSCMLEVLREDYIRTARAKGLRERLVVYRHALKNAALPVITVLSVQFGQLLGGAVVVETIFSLPGMGLNLVDSIFFRDYPMVQTIIVLIAVMFVFINLIVDLLYAWLDPRIRYA